MKTNILHIFLGISLFLYSIILIGCSNGHKFEPTTPGAPRLIAQGNVTNQDGQPLSNITVAIYGVREENESDMLSYNYAVTDIAGMYMIVRYAGRDTLTEVTLVATDSANVYAEQTVFAPVVYDGYAFVSANFVMEKQ